MTRERQPERVRDHHLDVVLVVTSASSSSASISSDSASPPSSSSLASVPSPASASSSPSPAPMSPVSAPTFSHISALAPSFGRSLRAGFVLVAFYIINQCPKKTHPPTHAWTHARYANAFTLVNGDDDELSDAFPLRMLAMYQQNWAAVN